MVRLKKLRLITTAQNMKNFLLPALSFRSILLYMCLLLSSGTVLAGVSATTNRSVLNVDEALRLEIKSENSSGDPDLSALETDFQILGRSQSQNYSLINGHASQTHIWSISLLPKRTGEITIPAIKVGSETTRPIHLVIQKQSSTPGIDGRKVFLKVSLSGNELANGKSDSNTIKSFYVQQQILLTVKLYHRIRFSNASLSDLEVNNTVVEKLGNDAHYTQIVGQHRYNIIEQHYALYPQQSGELQIPPLTFSGNEEIAQNFSLFSRPGQQIVSRTKPLTVNILPIPESYSGKQWLPAEQLEIEAEIVEDTSAIVAGEAITRHIVLRARGLLGSQLPAVSVASSAQIKTYPDKEKLSNQLVDGKVTGIRRDTIAIIPLKPGPFTLPEINIDWWNTKTNQQETAHLDARTFIAQKNSEQQIEDETDNKAAPSGKIEAADVQGDNKTDKASNTSIVEKIVYKAPALQKNLWFWISIILSSLWLITLALYFSALRKNGKQTHATPRSSHTEQQHYKNHLQAVFDACQENNASRASQALVAWARTYYQQPLLSGLSAVLQLIEDEQLSKAINDLESSQYAQDKHNWNGAALTGALQNYITQNNSQGGNKKSSTQALSVLNP